MGNDKIHLLVTLDQNYIGPFRTMLKSLVVNNPQETVHVWLLHSRIPSEALEALTEYCNAQRVTLTAVQVDPTIFTGAPRSKRYPPEMYYRLLAPLLLPPSVEKILYLDPDILVINSVRPLWETLLDGHVFAAASHSIVPDMVDDVNRMRLGTDHPYFNTGVILMDLKSAREAVNAGDIFEYVREHSAELLLPDQDVFNHLYGAYTKQVDDVIWNYDGRRFSAYLLNSNGKCDMDWVMQNTVFLHFCGKQKPWKSTHSSRFSALYKHYMQIAQPAREFAWPQNHPCRKK